jgi:hypothetical protein
MGMKTAALKEIYCRLIDKYGAIATHEVETLLVELEQKDKISATDIIKLESKLRNRLVDASGLGDTSSASSLHIETGQAAPVKRPATVRCR